MHIFTQFLTLKTIQRTIMIILQDLPNFAIYVAFIIPPETIPNSKHTNTNIEKVIIRHAFNTSLPYQTNFAIVSLFAPALSAPVDAINCFYRSLFHFDNSPHMSNLNPLLNPAVIRNPFCAHHHTHRPHKIHYIYFVGIFAFSLHYRTYALIDTYIRFGCLVKTTGRRTEPAKVKTTNMYSVFLLTYSYIYTHRLSATK